MFCVIDSSCDMLIARFVHHCDAQRLATTLGEHYMVVFR